MTDKETIMRRFSRILMIAGGIMLPAAAQAGTCIADDFNTFLPIFSESVSVQKTAVADPLIIVSLDFETADPEPVEVIRKIPLTSLDWPVLDPLSSLDMSHLQTEVTVEGDEARLLISGRESGEYITLSFRRSPCWTLTEIADRSM